MKIEITVAYGFEHSLREALKNMEVTPLDEEGKAWEEQQRLSDIQARNKASMAAWNAVGEYITENADKLGRLSIRQAFEEGYRRGFIAGASDGKG